MYSKMKNFFYSNYFIFIISIFISVFCYQFATSLKASEKDHLAAQLLFSSSVVKTFQDK